MSDFVLNEFGQKKESVKGKKATEVARSVADEVCQECLSMKSAESFLTKVREFHCFNASSLFVNKCFVRLILQRLSLLRSSKPYWISAWVCLDNVVIQHTLLLPVIPFALLCESTHRVFHNNVNHHLSQRWTSWTAWWTRLDWGRDLSLRPKPLTLRLTGLLMKPILKMSKMVSLDSCSEMPVVIYLMFHDKLLSLSLHPHLLLDRVLLCLLSHDMTWSIKWSFRRYWLKEVAFPLFYYMMLISWIQHWPALSHFHDGIDSNTIRTKGIESWFCFQFH